MTPEQYKQLFISMVEILQLMENIESHKPKQIFVDGEFDSNQTTFESLSTTAQLGVSAHSQVVGYTLLALLRMIIDERFDLLNLWLNDHDGLTTMNELIILLKEQETQYTDIFQQGEIISKTLCGGTILTNNIEDVDIWDIERVATFIRDKSFNEEDLDCLYKPQENKQE